MTRAGHPLRLLLLPVLAIALLLPLGMPASAAAQALTKEEQQALPELTQPVNDFAKVIDPDNAKEIDRICRVLLAATTQGNSIGDTIIVVTVPTYAPFADIKQFANRLFENHGRGIGDKQKDNGLLVVLAVDDRKVWIEVGYGLEGPITDGFSGETSRQFMAPFFREKKYGDGLRAGVARLASRIADERNVTLDNVRPPQQARRRQVQVSQNLWLYIFLGLFFFNLLRAVFRGGGRRRGPGGWSGWSGGVGPFGGGWGGGFGGGGGWSSGGGGGGGFGGFGGGSSGGGGGGSSW